MNAQAADRPKTLPINNPTHVGLSILNAAVKALVACEKKTSEREATFTKTFCESLVTHDKEGSEILCVEAFNPDQEQATGADIDLSWRKDAFTKVTWHLQIKMVKESLEDHQAAIDYVNKMKKMQAGKKEQSKPTNQEEKKEQPTKNEVKIPFFDLCAKSNTTGEYQILTIANMVKHSAKTLHNHPPPPHEKGFNLHQSQAQHLFGGFLIANPKEDFGVRWVPLSLVGVTLGEISTNSLDALDPSTNKGRKNLEKAVSSLCLRAVRIPQLTDSTQLDAEYKWALENK